MPDNYNPVDPNRKGPFWLGWNLTQQCADQWSAFCNKFVDEPIAPDELHFTMFYCNDGADPEKPWPAPMIASWDARPTGVGKLGKALVVLFDAPQFVHSRFAQLGKDYQHSFPTLIPHMSLSYGGSDSGNDSAPSIYTKIKDMGLGLQFNNEQVNKPNDPTDKACFMDVMSTIYPDYSCKQRFLDVLFSAYEGDPDIANAFASGNTEIFKDKLIPFVARIESERPKSDS